VVNAAVDCSEATVIGETDGETFINGYTCTLHSCNQSYYTHYKCVCTEITQQQ